MVSAYAASIRPVNAEDARALLALQRSIYREGQGFVGDAPPSLDALANKLRTLDPELSLYLVAVGPQGALRGWLELHRPLPSRLRHVAMLTLAVAEPYRRQGLARRLLHEAYGWARRVGVEKISLNVRANNRAALALYRAEGFRLEGRERAQIRLPEGYEDNLIMAKFLASDPAHG